MSDHHNRRSDTETRELIERVAEAAARKALQQFSDLTPWNMETKEGRDDARLTIAHADALRRGCEAMKSDGAAMARRAAWTLFFIALAAGVVWLFGINPAKFKFLNGNMP